MASSSNKSFSVLSNASIVAKQRVREELKKISHTQIHTSDLQKLREEIIPPKTPLPQQKQIVTEVAEKHETHLGTHFTSLDLLQDTIKGLETEVSRLLQESTQAQEELKRRRQKLNDGLVELLRLQKLIEQINKEISEKTFEFESKLDEMGKKRLDILNDPNLSEEEKEKLLADLDKEMNDLKKGHASALSLLQNEKEKLKDEARMEAQIIQTALRDLEQEQFTVIEELEKAKIGASPSEVLRIEAKILEKRQQYEKNLEVLDKSVSSKKYFFDDQGGRYYLNEEGVKIYKRDSNASEHMVRPDLKEPTQNVIENKIVEHKRSFSCKTDLNRREQKLCTGVMKLLRLHELIGQVNQEVSDKNDILSLQSEKEKLKDEARIEANLLQVMFKELEDENLNVLEELQKLKIEPSPSEILTMVEKYATHKKYFFDDRGRFYYDQNGVRVYKEDLEEDSATSDLSLSDGDKTINKHKRSHEELRKGLVKLLRLQKHIEEIDKEICKENLKKRDCSKQNDVKQKPLKMARGEKLSNEKKRKIIENLDEQLCELKQVHANTVRLQKNIKQIDKDMCVKRTEVIKQVKTVESCQSQKPKSGLICLQFKKEKLKDEARIEAQVLQSAFKDLKEQNMNVVQELEKLKIGTSPLELLKIVEKCATSNKYCFDDKGRFYISEDGCRHYKQYSCSSVCIKGVDEKLCHRTDFPGSSSKYRSKIFF